MKLNMGDVEVTALIPLTNRASETTRKKPRIRDEKAVEIINALGIDTKNYDKLITHECVIARTIMFDNQVKQAISEHDGVVVVNLGCGLDNRFERVDNGRIMWFDIDLPDSIAVRRKIYHDTDRRSMIAGSVLDTGWMATVKRVSGTQPVIFVAEGLFMYFSKQQTKAILHHLASYFEQGLLLVELMRPSMMDERRHDTVKHTNAKFGWGTTSGKELESLEPRMSLVSEHSFSEQMMQSTLISRIIGLVSMKINNRLAVFQWGRVADLQHPDRAAPLVADYPTATVQ